MIYDRAQIQITTLHDTIAFTGKTILEIGCGDGKISVLLAKGSDRYIAIDPDEEKIEQAALIQPEDDPALGRPEFRVGSGYDLPFPDNSVDLVLFTLSLHHQDSGRALDEAFRVLIPGGHVLVLEPSDDGQFQKCCHLFNNETRVLEAARQGIRQSRFRRIKAFRFSVTAEFQGLEDIFSYYFDREKEASGDRERIERLLADFGKMPVSGPFDLEELLDLYLLEKELP